MESAYRIALLPGDGTGIELGEQTKRLLLAVSERAGIQFDIDEIPCGGQYYLEQALTGPRTQLIAVETQTSSSWAPSAGLPQMARAR